MADGGPSLDEVRLRLIEQFEKDEWEITGRARQTGIEFLRRRLKDSYASEYSLVRHVPRLMKKMIAP